MYFFVGNSNLTENSEPLVNELFEKTPELLIKASFVSISVPDNAAQSDCPPTPFTSP